MSETLSRSHIKDCILATAVATLISAILVLVFAIVTKFLPMGDGAISITNIAIKALSVFLGVFTQVKNSSKGFVKGAFTGVAFSLISLLILILLGGEFDWSSFSLDMGVCLAVGVLTGMLSASRNR